MGAGAAPVPAVNAEVQAFDGTRQPFGNETQFGITIIDGNQQQVSRDFYDEPNVRFKLPVHENLADNYTSSRGRMDISKPASLLFT